MSGKSLLITILILIVAGVAIGLYARPSQQQLPQLSSSTTTQTQQQGSAGTQTPPTQTQPPANLPPLTATIKAQLAASSGFSVLVSYTKTGFEPSDTSVAEGTTIRFTNNSGSSLQLCGDGTFSSCKTIADKNFWEYTFTTAGTFNYKDADSTAHTGVVRVK